MTSPASFKKLEKDQMKPKVIRKETKSLNLLTETKQRKFKLLKSMVRNKAILRFDFKITKRAREEKRNRGKLQNSQKTISEMAVHTYLPIIKCKWTNSPIKRQNG